MTWDVRRRENRRRLDIGRVVRDVYAAIAVVLAAAFLVSGYEHHVRSVGVWVAAAVGVVVGAAFVTYVAFLLWFILDALVWEPVKWCANTFLDWLARELRHRAPGDD